MSTDFISGTLFVIIVSDPHSKVGGSSFYAYCVNEETGSRVGFFVPACLASKQHSQSFNPNTSCFRAHDLGSVMLRYPFTDEQGIINTQKNVSLLTFQLIIVQQRLGIVLVKSIYNCFAALLKRKNPKPLCLK